MAGFQASNRGSLQLFVVRQEYMMISHPSIQRRLWLTFLLALVTAAYSIGRAAAAAAVTVPFTLHGVYIYLEVSLNGKPATFVLDTGAGANVVTPKTVEKFDLVHRKGKAAVVGAGGKAGSASIVKVAEIGIGASKTRNQSAYVIPLPEQLRCDGLLGAPFLQTHVVTIDYEKSRMTIGPTDDFAPPPDAEAMPLRFYGNTPFVEATADGCKGWFRIDTGAGNAVSLFAPFVQKNHLDGKYSPSVRTITGRGVGGLIYGDLVRIPEFKVGPFSFPKVVTELSRQTEGVFADSQNAGNLGGELFRRFTVTFDYSSSKVYLTKNSTYDAPFKANRSGLAIDSQNGAQIVRDVVAESPATEAGIAAGDVIREVNGTPVEKIASWEMNEILRRDPGTKVRLRVKSSDKTEREIVLTLRDLI